VRLFVVWRFCEILRAAVDRLAVVVADRIDDPVGFGVGLGC